MYYDLVTLISDALFGGIYPSSLAQYLVEMLSFLCIGTLIILPISLVYGIVRRLT